MAKIAALPALSVISGFHGVLDFYTWCNLNIVRSWPRSPGHKRAPAVEAQWSPFRYASKAWTSMTPEVQDSFRAISSGTGLSARDMATRAYLSGLHRMPPGY